MTSSRSSWDHIVTPDRTVTPDHTITPVLAVADAGIGRRTPAALVGWRKDAGASLRNVRWPRVIIEWKSLVDQASSSCALPVAAIGYNIFGRALRKRAVAILPSAQAVRMRFVARAQAVCTAASMVCMMA